MTRASSSASGDVGQKLWTRELVFTLLTVFGIFLGYQTLLVVLPLEIADQGGGNTVVGLGTGVFMVAAVMAQLSTPRLIACYRIRSLLFSALLLLGIPSLLQPLTDSVSLTFGLNILRGFGIGVGSVVGATSVSMLSPPARRGEALGLFGLMTAMPSVVGPVTALALLQTSSFAMVFVVLGLVTLSACAVTLLLGSLQAPVGERQSGILQVSRQPMILLPFFTFAAMTAVYGGILTFAPLHLMGSQGNSPQVFILALGTTFALSRFYGGVIVDRVGDSRVLFVGLLCSMVSVPLLGWVPFSYASLLSGVLFGSSLGVLATSTHFRLVSRASSRESGVANALFNVAFNAGIGIGGPLFGSIAGVTGYTLMFTATVPWIGMAFVVFLVDLMKFRKEGKG